MTLMACRWRIPEIMQRWAFDRVRGSAVSHQYEVKSNVARASPGSGSRPSRPECGRCPLNKPTTKYGHFVVGLYNQYRTHSALEGQTPIEIPESKGAEL